MKLRAHGLRFEVIKPVDPAATLHGLLNSHNFHVFRVFADGAQPGRVGARLLSMSAREVESITDVDDVVVPWSTPVEADLNEKSARLIGLTFNPRWLQSAFIAEVRPFHPDAQELSVHIVNNTDFLGKEISLKTSFGVKVPLILTNPQQDSGSSSQQALRRSVGPAFQSAVQAFMTSLSGNNPASQATALPTTPRIIAAVPAPLLAHLTAAEQGRCIFDQSTGEFPSPVQSNVYFRGRAVAKDIHAVPELDEFFAERGYAVISQRGRVEELEGHLKSIALWTRVVIGTVAGLGFVTLVMTLLDNTQRKRRSIGLLLSLGAGRLAIAYVFTLRAFLIGTLAAVTTVGLAVLAAHGLTTWGAACRLSSETLTAVSGLAVLACLIGAIASIVPLQNASPGDVMDAPS